MKKNILVLFFLLAASQVFAIADMLDPYKWEVSLEKLSKNEYDLIITARIDSGWHVYSQHLPENGPVATDFIFVDAGKGYELIGETIEPESVQVYDPFFQMNINWFDTPQVRFVQRVKVTDKTLPYIKVEATAMACNDTQCLPPSVEELIFEFKGVADGDALSGSFWGLFFFTFGLGLLALLTPCVYPMVPMTVSFFLKQSSSHRSGIFKAGVYGLSIVAIYVVLGLSLTLIFGPTILNDLATNPWFNIFFFLLLAAFGLSFLGAFEITLPSKWVNAADKKADRGGYWGIFFMALALALVSFSCTGPFIGTILVETASGGRLSGPIIGMLGFSLGIAIPFTLFAIFPSWLKGMPSSGGWLNSVKVVLGLLELALALKFLSTADMVLQTRFLHREVYLCLWIAIFTVLTLYLLRKVRFAHDDPNGGGLSVTRGVLGIFSLAFTLYLIPGLWGAPLKMISGLIPPKFYSESPVGFFGTSVAPSATLIGGGSGAVDVVVDDKMEIGPEGIPVFKDYEAALRYAKEVKKPLLLDFTGWGCANCREMEATVWADPRVKAALTNDFVVASLYVDEKTALPESAQYTGHGGKKIKTVGNKWSDFQITRFGGNSQPFYIVVDQNGDPVGEGRGFDRDVEAYLEWLAQTK